MSSFGPTCDGGTDASLFLAHRDTTCWFEVGLVQGIRLGPRRLSAAIFAGPFSVSFEWILLNGLVSCDSISEGFPNI